MRAAILLIPLVAFAAYSASRPPDDRYANATAGDESMMTMNDSGDPANDSMFMDMDMSGRNAAEQAAANAEAAADMSMAEYSNESMDMGMTNGSFEAIEGNSTAPERLRPYWLSTGFWLIAAEEASGAIWYFEPFASDFRRSPFRVILRTDESQVAARRHNNTERRIELDCGARTYRLLSTTHYDDAGNAAQSLRSGDGGMTRPSPGSAWAEVVDAVCLHDANQRSGEVTTNAM